MGGAYKNLKSRRGLKIWEEFTKNLSKCSRGLVEVGVV